MLSLAKRPSHRKIAQTPSPEELFAPRLASKVELTDYLAEKLLTDCLDLLLNDETIALEFDVAQPPLSGRKWWPDDIPPTLTDKDISDKWIQITQGGLACEVLAWADAVSFLGIADRLATALVRFQYNETVLDPAEPCPAPWSCLGYQAVVAAYNLLWLAGAESVGATQQTVEPVRAALRHWLTKQVDLTMARPGGILILDLLYRKLINQRPVMDSRVSWADQNYQHFLEKRRGYWWGWIRWIWPGTWLSASRRRREREQQKCKLLYFQENARKARADYQELLGLWWSASPLTRLVPPDYETVTANTTEAPVFSIISDSHDNCRVYGSLENWLLREMVRRAPLVSNKVDPYSQILAASLEGLTKIADYGRGNNGCSAALFLLRLYRLWVRFCPNLSETLARIDRLSGEERKWCEQFIHPWEKLQNIAQQYVQPASVEPDVTRFTQEYLALFPPLQIPHENEEQYDGTRLERIRKHLQREVELHVQTSGGA